MVNWILQEEHDALEVHRAELLAETKEEGQADVGMKLGERIGSLGLCI